jgi:hypothetical protein
MDESYFVGVGLVELDVALMLLAATSALIQYWRIANWYGTLLMLSGRWMMAIGWTSLATRVGYKLFTDGDILISLPSLVSLILIAAGSIIVTLFWHPASEGPR